MLLNFFVGFLDQEKKKIDTIKFLMYGSSMLLQEMFEIKCAISSEVILKQEQST